MTTTWIQRTADRLARIDFPAGNPGDPTCGCGKPKTPGTITCDPCAALNRHNSAAAGIPNANGDPNATRVAGLARVGYTDTEIAAELGLAVQSIKRIRQRAGIPAQKANPR